MTVGEGQPSHRPLRYARHPTALAPSPEGKPPAGSLAAILAMAGPGDTSLGATGLSPEARAALPPATLNHQLFWKHLPRSPAGPQACHTSIGKDRHPCGDARQLPMVLLPSWILRVQEHPLGGAFCQPGWGWGAGTPTHPPNPAQQQKGHVE